MGADYSNTSKGVFNPTLQATAYNDINAYGSLYQWGRYSDGHELINRTNSTAVNGSTATLSTTNSPSNNLFIINASAPQDWRNPQNTNLWQGVIGTNNPCPVGYRVPTVTEWTTLVSSAGISNYTTAASSSLKLSVPGYRNFNDAALTNVGAIGDYWSSTVNTTNSSSFQLLSASTNTQAFFRAWGQSVRCIKDNTVIATVTALNCSSAVLTGNLAIGSAASGVSIAVPYSGGNSGVQFGETVTSTGVTGLTATLAASLIANGSGSFTYTITGTPASVGTASFAINEGGQSCTVTALVTDNSSNGTAAVSSYTCSTASAGNLTAGVAVSGVSQTITANVTTAGTYSIATAAVNGVTFAGTGTFASTGSQTVVLTATGTPTSATASPYTYTLATTPSCTFTRTVTDNSSGGTSVIGSITACNTTVTGSMVAGTTVSGVSQTITVNVTTAGTYSIATAAVNGVTFAGSGTFASTGSQTVVLTASGTPTAATASPYSYVLNTTPSCTFTRTVTDPSSNGSSVIGSITACNTTVTGTMSAGTTVSGVSQTITVNVTTVGTYNISATMNGVTFAGTGTFASTGSQTVVLTATGKPTVTGTNTFTLNTNPTCSFSRSVNSSPSTNGSAVVLSYTETGSAGQLQEGSSANAYTNVTANVQTIGTYNITGTAYGVTYSASGTFTSTGSQNIRFNASGVPNTPGTGTWSMNVSPGICFTYSILPAP